MPQSISRIMDAIAPQYEKGEGINDWFTAPIVKYYCPASATAALEIGCGVGRLSCELAQNVETVWGIDISKKMIEYARRRANRAERRAIFFEGDCTTFEFGAQTFDYIFGVYVLSYFDIPCLLERLTSQLRPRGRMLFIDGNVGASEDLDF